MKWTYFLQGILAIVPAFILMYSLREFGLLSLDGDFFSVLFSAIWIAFVSLWSIYILSISNLLKNKKIPTSLQGMQSTLWVSVGYFFSFLGVLFFYFKSTYKLEFTIFSIVLLFLGFVISGALLGFYIGYSKARLADESAKAFILRQLGVLVSALVLSPCLLLAFKAKDDWIASNSIIYLLFLIAIVVGHYARAQKQSKNYMNRRQKLKNVYAPQSGSVSHSKMAAMPS